MAFVIEPAHAKINLALDVVGKRRDGYHELRMIMQSVELHDDVSIEEVGAGNRGIVMECSNEAVPPGPRNIAWKAAEALMGMLGIKKEIKISISKKIPAAAGLAGGSSDAAAVLRGLNRLFMLGLSNDELLKVGAEIGADVPYCIIGGTRLAEGIGEILSPLPEFNGVDVVIVRPKIDVSTPDVYRCLDMSLINESDRPDVAAIITALKKKDVRSVAAGMRNVLELVTIPRHEAVREAKDKLVAAGALGSLMSGSGPSAFGLFPDEDSASKAYVTLSADSRWECFKTRTIGSYVKEMY